MRVNLHKPVSVGVGDTVAITCRLPRGQDFARLSVWSASEGYELSPHVFAVQLTFAHDSDGRPTMVKPLAMNLHEKHRTHRIEFVADEALTFVVRQDIDVDGDPLAKAKVKRYGKTFSQIRRRVRDAIRALRNRAENGFWPKGRDRLV